jgi:Carboxypeptidase regulatory-like domain
MKSAVLLFAAAGAMLAQSPCSLRGVVLDGLTKQPLKRAQVFAKIASDSDESLPIRQVTDAQGAFCFETLAAGDYLLHASRAFYVDAAYGEHWPGGHARKLAVPAEKSANPIRIEMMPQAIISGTLVDGDGDPVQGARVELVKAHWAGQKLTALGIDQTTTDDQGRYRFARLASGTYFVSATPPSVHEREGLPLEHVLDENHQSFKQTQGRTFYKDAISLRDATAVHVRPGQEISDLALGLRTAEARRLSGHVLGELLTSHFPIALAEEDTGAPGVWLNIPAREDGSFAAEGLFPDRYEVYAGQARTEVDLTNGDIDDLILDANSPMDLQITVHYESGKAAPPVRSLTLINKDPRALDYGRPIETQLIADNKFHLNLYSGQFEVDRVGDGLPYFIRELVFDGHEQRGNILDLKGSGPKSMELFLSSKPAIVEGRVPGASAETPVTVLLENESDPQAAPKILSSPDGQFQWTVTRGGRYRIYAFEDFDEDSWANPEMPALLADKSTAVEIKEGAHFQIQPPVISGDEYAAAMKQAGY